ncbi:MAG: zf-HC2 domain-containing protein [Planctomycetes bacterium]|nr:zf-HC2 domain-containing protein [Planctomycetota bacterium]
MDCNQAKKIFPALLTGELPQGPAAEAEEHMLSCEDCSREFEVFETRFFGQYEPAGKAIAAAAKAPLPQLEVDKFYAGLKARLSGECAKVEGAFVALAGGELEKSAEEGVAAHLQSCEPCSKAFEGYESKIFGQYEAAGKALAAARAVAPPEAALTGFYQKVMARIARDRGRSNFRRAALALNAAAVLMIAVSLGVLLGHQEGQAPVAVPENTAKAPAGNTALPPTPVVDRELTVPAASGVRRFTMDNVRHDAFYADPGRRAGRLDVVRPDGNHGLDEARPFRDGDSVGF